MQAFELELFNTDYQESVNNNYAGARLLGKPGFDMKKETADVIDILEYLGIIWRWKWMVVLTVVLITALAILLPFFFIAPKYESSTQLLQRRLGLDEAFVGTAVFQEDSSAPERSIDTSIALIKSPEVSAAVMDRMGVRLGSAQSDDLIGFINVKADKNVEIIEIRATYTDPVIAADIANAFAEEFVNWKLKIDKDVLTQARIPIEQQIDSIPVNQRNTTDYSVLLNKLETLKLSESLLVGKTQVINKAQPSYDQVSPKPVLNGLLAFITSIFLGIGLVIAIDLFDKTIRNVEYITSRIDVPVLANIPREPKTNGTLVTISHSDGSNSEAYRLLKTNLRYLNPDKKTKTILVTSPGPFEGKSTTISNLAVTLARGGYKVTALELDFRRPSLAKHLHLKDVPGITNVIAGTHKLEEVIQAVPAKDLMITRDHVPVNEKQKIAVAEGLRDVFCLVSGPIPPNPGELVASEIISKIILETGENSDYVLIDTPPLGVVGDAASIAPIVDGVIVIIRMGYTKKSSFSILQETMKNLPANLLGFVITDADIASASYSSGYYSYIHNRPEISSQPED